MIKIGNVQNYLNLDILYRNYPNSDDYWDANWLTTEISIQIGAWKGKYQAQFLTKELESLKEDLEKLDEAITYTFEFKPMEPWIMLKFTGNKLGQIEIEGKACDQIGIGNTLTFSLIIDQTYLKQILDELKDINKKYPTKGKP